MSLLKKLLYTAEGSFYGWVSSLKSGHIFWLLAEGEVRDWKYSKPDSFMNLLHVVLTKCGQKIKQEISKTKI
jgi:hypothetical protein